ADPGRSGSPLRQRADRRDRRGGTDGRRSRLGAGARACELSDRPAGQDGLRIRTASGGNVSATECGWPCHGRGSAPPPPPLSTLLSPYSAALVLSGSPE